MKRLEKMALVWIVLLVATQVGAALASFFVPRWLGPDYPLEWHTSHVFATMTRLFLLAPLNLAVGIWLFVSARKCGAMAWVWLLLALFFGLIAAVLFYAWRVHTMLESSLGNQPAFPVQGGTDEAGT